MKERDDILKRLYIAGAALLVFALAVGCKLLWIQLKEGKDLIALAEETVVKQIEIDATRGNIYAADGSLLATSMPKYEVRLDVMTIPDELFEAEVSDLAKSLSAILQLKSASQHERYLRQARSAGNRYLFLASEIDFIQYQQLRHAPILRAGKYRGGLIAIQINTREMPFQKMAERTIGYERDGLKVGLEGAFNDELSGRNGKRLNQKIAGGHWKPLNDGNRIEPRDGSDLVTTIDPRIQDIAHQALLRRLEIHEADHGCVVLMDVKTGAIKAMVNLGRTEEGKYYEKRNYAVWESTEPGSTFKLPALMAALEDGVVDTSEQVNTNGGIFKFYGTPVKDSRKGGYGVISLGRAFEVSSNVGISRVINEHYQDRPQKFVDRLYKMGLADKTGIEIPGEGKPKIPTPKDPAWSGITLPWMSHGYAVSMTPLQTLNFYNAVANNGQMMKPYLVKEIQRNGKTVRSFEPEVMNPMICSQETLSKVQKLLVGVVERGTATNIYTERFSIAGKTGTCKLNYWKQDEYPEYQASFAGYFPADRPMYSCIVVISKPNNSTGYYGNRVAGPVFEEIAHKLYNNDPILNGPVVDAEAQALLAMADLPLEPTKRSLENTNTLPNMSGWDAMEAVYWLENHGIEVHVKGIGKVKRQSIRSGESIKAVKSITLELN